MKWKWRGNVALEVILLSWQKSGVLEWRTPIQGALDCSGIFYLADNDVERSLRTRDWCPSNVKKCNLLTLVINMSISYVGNLVEPAQLSEVCRILLGARSAEAFTMSSQLHWSACSFCRYAEYKQNPNLASTFISAAGWGGKSWFNANVPDQVGGEEDTAYLQTEQIQVWEFLKHKVWIPRIVFYSRFSN